MNASELPNFIIFCYFNRYNIRLTTYNHIMPFWIIMFINCTIFNCLPSTQRNQIKILSHIQINLTVFREVCQHTCINSIFFLIAIYLCRIIFQWRYRYLGMIRVPIPIQIFGISGNFSFLSKHIGKAFWNFVIIISIFCFIRFIRLPISSSIKF